MLEQGTVIPTLSLPGDDGASHALVPGKGKLHVIYFYPKDSTSGCTREAQDFTALVDDFAKHGATVIGISRDSTKSHTNFKTKYELGVLLLTDADHAVHEAFGAWGTKMMYGNEVLGAIRSTFLVNDKGVVLRAWKVKKVDGHAAEVLAATAAIARPT